MLRTIGVGLGRTGTMTLKTALCRLGLGPCYHFTEVFAHPDHLRDWLAAARGEPQAWRRPLAGYAATTDWPGVAFWREMVDARPDAKIILTTRDAGKWYESVTGTVFAAMAGKIPETSARLAAFPAAKELAEFGREAVVGRTFGGDISDREHVIACYERHNQEVRDTVPAGRLLDYRVAQGWEPLCDFLGVPVPAEPFPHTNEQSSFAGTVLRPPADAPRPGAPAPG
ncbi:sulfotransferase family protein [Sphaerisporangium rufum]|uniref:Sulfotransferase family protein n=1 Tax=Sphaerisporangium rufum TaxID=1381558 RepID=A0A919V3H8_9ACTN|nr:sulfotransferase family protein [Sphaerisporangium rufum]GII76305.1 sulfotransferase family protein [Sphaerisporangium rufum]